MESGQVTVETTVKERIRRVLSQRESTATVQTGLIPSAVVLPLFEDGGEYHILLTKRTEKVKHHKGQICFPGGTCEADEIPMATALRETFEEIGLQAQDVEILGKLDPMRTVSTNFIIHPFVAVIPYPYQFRLNTDEIERIVSVPVAALLDKTRFREETAAYGGERYPAYYYQYEGDVIWGATARILKEFLDLVYCQGKP